MKELEKSWGEALGNGVLVGVAPVLYLRFGLNEEYEAFRVPGCEGVFDCFTSLILGFETPEL